MGSFELDSIVIDLLVKITWLPKAFFGQFFDIISALTGRAT